LTFIILAVLAVVTLPYWSFFTSSLFYETTITFQNNSGKLIQINAKIIEVEQDDFEWKYESEIKNGDKDTIIVDPGIKCIKYTIDQTKGEIEFDMWNGEDVTLIINSNKKIETVR